MKGLKLFFIQFICIVLVVSCSDDSGDTTTIESLNPLESYDLTNISYGNNSDQVFDLYLPANRTPDTGVLILVHGGGWTSGDKVDMTMFKDFIKAQMPEYAIVNMNYRLATPNNPPYPMQINDISSVVDYLMDTKEEYIISDNLGFVGVSAGGHLSLLWSYAFDNNNQVKMVCSIVGPTNFTDPEFINNSDQELQEVLNSLGFNTSTEFAQEVSPYHRATTTSPPTILFYGGEDPLIPTSQGIAMQEKLNDLNVINDFTLYPNEGHGWIGLNLIDTSLKLKSFIETYL